MSPAPGRNPYLNRVMIRDVTQFYGRRREVAKIFARIGASRPQSVAIVGERRTGKSSFLNYIFHPDVRKQHLDHTDAYTFVFMDLQERREIGVPAFFEALFEGIGHALGRRVQDESAVDYEGVRRGVSRLHSEGRKIILLFDEFDAITRNPNFPEEFFAFLRAIANKYDVAYVTTSRQDLQQLCHAERIADSPFFNIFSNLFLTRFERDEALQLIREPSAAAGLPLAPHEAAILDMAGLLPFFLQVACSAFFEHLAESAMPAEALAKAARASFIEEAEPHFNYIYEHLDEDQRAALADLAAGRPVPPSRSYLLNRLKRDGYVLEDQGRERLFSSVFSEYVREGQLRVRSSSSGGAGLPPSRKASADRRSLGESGQPRPAPAAAEAGHYADKTRLSYPPAPGDSLSHFRIIEPLGRGGMGLVFLAEDVRLRRHVALKVLLPEVVGDPERKARFLQEARAASLLTHPNVAVVHEVDEVDGISFIAMERIEGHTLRHRLAEGRLPLADVLSIGRQTMAALGAAHARGIVHRDVKPENIMITADGHVKVLDFGLAKLAVTFEGNDTMTAELALATRQGVTLGTVKYMAPEQVAGEAVDHRADIFALGIVLFEMATGRAPFGGATNVDVMHAILHEPVSAQDLAGVEPAGLQQVIARALEKDLNERYPSMRDFARDLAAVAESPAPRTSFADRVRGWFRS
jgi:hypothetical protein